MLYYYYYHYDNLVKYYNFRHRLSNIFKLVKRVSQISLERLPRLPAQYCNTSDENEIVIIILDFGQIKIEIELNYAVCGTEMNH